MVRGQTEEQKRAKREYARARVTRLKEAGLCVRCGKHDHIPAHVARNHPKCESCYFKHVAKDTVGDKDTWEFVRDLFYDQNCLCAYTGERLELGVNAQLDHRKPTIRHPEHRGNLANLQWLSSKVNLAKRDMEEDEFFTMCQSVTNHTSQFTNQAQE